MRRWTLVCVVALQAAVLITLSGPMGAMAATSTSTNFKGKASVYYRNSGPYFVVNFTCSNGGLSGNWTYDTRTNSYSGNLAAAGSLANPACELIGSSSGGGPWKAGPGESTYTIPSFSGATLSMAGNPNVGTLTLGLVNISATKTYVADTTNDQMDPEGQGCVYSYTHSATSPCIEITTSNLAPPIGGSFDSAQLQPGFGTPYGTLNLTLP